MGRGGVAAATWREWGAYAGDLAWAGAPPGLALRLLMLANRQCLEVPHTRHGQGLTDEAFGLRIAQPEAFRHLDLSHPAFDAIRPRHRI